MLNLKKTPLNSVLLYVLLIAALGIHLLSFDRFPLQFDELLMFDLVDKMPLKQLLHYLLTVEVQMPLPYLLAKFMLGIGLGSEFSLRFPALVSTMIMALIFYRLAQYTLDKKNALRATVLLLFFYPLFEFSGSMRPNALMLLFSVLMIMELKKRAFHRHYRSLGLISFALFLIHPMGAVFVFLFLALMLFQERAPKYLLALYAFFCFLVISLIVYFRAHDIAYIFAHKGRLFELRKITYIFSGPIFTLSTAALAIFFMLKKRSVHAIGALDRDHLILFLSLFLVSTVLFMVFPHYIHPRHFLLLLPSLAVLLVELLEKSGFSHVYKNVLFYLMMAILFIKAIFIENILTRPYEIESKKMAVRAVGLSENRSLIISCGNCLSYYIKSNLECIGPSLQLEHMKELSKENPEFVLINFDYSRSSCSPSLLRDYEIREQYNYIGGSVSRLSRRP